MAIVSEGTARRFWANEDPIGRTIRPTAGTRLFTLVGIVGDVRSTTLNRQSPALYMSSGRGVWPLMDVAVRTGGDPQAILPSVRQKLRELDPQLPLATVRTMEEWVSNTAAQPRLNAQLLGIFAAVAVLVAAIGIYGVLAYSVNQRTREIGLRMALGAPRSGVLRLVIGEGMRVGLAGIAVGVAAALAVSRLLSTLLFGVRAQDPATFAGVAILLALVALAACVFPAQRASRVDPLVALRDE
jgi:putative ABC transport system permease protein